MPDTVFRLVYRLRARPLVVHGIVTSHGGSIDVESALGEGTIFLVCFPRAPEAATQEAPAV